MHTRTKLQRGSGVSIATVACLVAVLVGILWLSAASARASDRIAIGPTDARLAVAPIVLLIDDRELQPPENVVPLVREDAVDRWGEDLRTALYEVSARLTSNDLRQLNRAVELDGLTPTEAARGWWEGA